MSTKRAGADGCPDIPFSSTYTQGLLGQQFGYIPQNGRILAFPKLLVASADFLAACAGAAADCHAMVEELGSLLGAGGQAEHLQ